MASQKQIHSLVVDTGPLIKNTISISTIIQSAEKIYTTPAILSEIRDKVTRARVETTLLPFLNVRNPSPASYEHVAQFSKKTGDFPVLSRQDLGILALAFEIDQEIKRQETKGNEGPESKGPISEASASIHEKQENTESLPILKEDASTNPDPTSTTENETTDLENVIAKEELSQTEDRPAIIPEVPSHGGISQEKDVQEPIALLGDSSTLTEDQTRSTVSEIAAAVAPAEEASVEEASAPILPGSLLGETVEESMSNLEVSPRSASETEDDDGGEWITPTNLKKHQAKDSGVSFKETEPQRISVATMTTDYAMQNVLLQMKLALISPSMQRIRNLRTFILRCHACFLTTKEMEKQFCPRCGQPTLQRISCSTNAKGEFKLHFSKNYQWNNRGNKFSVPKLSAGTASGKNVKGGGKGGWGNDLILTADQKEYLNKIGQQKKTQTRDLMDEDYLPNILTGDRAREGGRPKVGGGRNVNSRKFNS
ncbi:Nin one binding Zn-ribbon like-domain-containing protein [Dendryphion nanum]|uniref:20S-pre-rRNA D-site endonuclease NOB1 n=1 Tax=Dendryphion nanum TaxID=256645 RepID=A0A9P9EDS1_9PLEO|nr:Nin one binding Zn-ribbon like-domain-containing protein [Dendryphion nanum]